MALHNIAMPIPEIIDARKETAKRSCRRVDKITRHKVITPGITSYSWTRCRRRVRYYLRRLQRGGWCRRRLWCRRCCWLGCRCRRCSRYRCIGRSWHRCRCSSVLRPDLLCRRWSIPDSRSKQRVRSYRDGCKGRKGTQQQGKDEKAQAYLDEPWCATIPAPGAPIERQRRLSNKRRPIG